jgi:hypothetical protein
MIKMSTKNIQSLEKKRKSYLNELLHISSMIRGSYKESYCRCGKPTCWCSIDKKSKGHPSHRISWTKNSKSKTKSIPKEDVEWIKEMTENYRKYRTIRTKLRDLNNELKVLLDNLEEEVIKKTEKLKYYF